MSLGKGIGFAVAGAAAGGLVWGLVGLTTGLNLWLLAPIIGGAAGYGMMRGTSMKGGLPAGIAAAMITVVAIVSTRFALARHDVGTYLAENAGSVRESLAAEVADEWAEQHDDVQVYDYETEDFTDDVYAEADSRWDAMSKSDQDDYLAGMHEGMENAQAVLTPIALIFDFGIFGLIFTGLSAATAFKTGSITLERALIEQGHANETDVHAVAANLRAEDAAKRNGGFTPHMTDLESEADVDTPAHTPAPSLAENAGIFGMLAKREAETPKPLGRPLMPRAEDSESREAA